MAQRLKTVEYYFPVITTLADNVATSADQITIFIPETAGRIFRKAIVDVIVADKYTTASNITARNIELNLGGGGYVAVNNTSTLTNSGENFSFLMSGDFTSLFAANFAGTSMTADCRLTINGSAAGSANASIRVQITYEFDDAAATHLKTVWIPLDAPRTALGTTKSAVIDTIPALDTYCPEASKVFRQLTVVVQGNSEGNSVTDSGMSIEVGSLGAFTSALYEFGSNVDYWYRLSYDCTAMDTSVTQSLYLWAATADFDHPQVWLVATYEFAPASTTTILNSLILPMEIDSPMGSSAANYQRAKRELWIQEPGPIVSQRLAYYMHYDKLAAIAGLNARVGTGTFRAYTDVAATMAGGAGLMIRDEGPTTLARGRNSISVDVYRTDTTDLGYNVCGWWIVNYTSGVPSQGIWAANHTVYWNLAVIGTSSAAVERIVPAEAPIIPGAHTFRTSVGTNYLYVSNITGNPAGVHVGVERLPLEGGTAWESVYADIGGTDPEVGIRQCWASARNVFNRWMGDVDLSRLTLQDERRWRCCLAQNCASFDHLDLIMTYHSITFPVEGEITGSSGGLVVIYVNRFATGEAVMADSRIGNGSFSIPWYDNTEEVYIQAIEDGTSLVGMSAPALAGS